MRIHLAQIRSEAGHLERNVARHLAALRALAPAAGDLVAFPELSLSNYEPEIAGEVALTPDDVRLEPLRTFADSAGAVVAAGAPLRSAGKPRIAMLVFTPGRAPVVIEKRRLHADELPWFSAADGPPAVLEIEHRVGVAICYELSVAEHAEALMARRPDVYLATVAKTPSGVAAAEATLAETARRHGVPVLMVNGVGTCEGRAAGGGSLAIDAAGAVLARLGDAAEGGLVYDPEARTVAIAAGFAPERAAARRVTDRR